MSLLCLHRKICCTRSRDDLHPARRQLPLLGTRSCNRTRLQEISKPTHLKMTATSVSGERASTDAADATNPVAIPHSQPSGWQVRTYVPNDLEQIIDVCKDIMSGYDYVPRLLPQYAANPKMMILVAECQDEAGKLDGIIFCERRADMGYLFGLRVRSTTRGKGVASMLVNEVHQQAPQLLGQDIACFSTVTWTANYGAIKSLQKKMVVIRDLEFWPPFEQLIAYEKSIGWPQQKPTAERSLLASMPGTWDVLQQDSAAAQLLPHWRPASSTAELEQAVAALRTLPLGDIKGQHAAAAAAKAAAAAAAAANGSGSSSNDSNSNNAASNSNDGKHTNNGSNSHNANGSNSHTNNGSTTTAAASAAATVSRVALHPTLATSMTLYWDSHPARYEFTEQLVASGQAWVLTQNNTPTGPAQTNEQGPTTEPSQAESALDYLGVMVIAPSEEGGNRQALTVIASSVPVMHSALLRATQDHPHFVAFFERRGSAGEGMPEMLKQQQGQLAVAQVFASLADGCTPA